MILAAIIVAVVMVAVAAAVLFFLPENEQKQALVDSPMQEPFVSQAESSAPAISLYDEVEEVVPETPVEKVVEKPAPVAVSAPAVKAHQAEEAEVDSENEYFEGVPTEMDVASMMNINSSEPEPGPELEPEAEFEPVDARDPLVEPEPAPAPAPAPAPKRAPEPEPGFRDLLEGLFAEPVPAPQPKPKKPAKPRKKPQPKNEEASKPESFTVSEPVPVPLPSEDDEPAELAIDEYIYIGADDYMPPLLEEIETLLLENLGRVKVTFYYGVTLLENAYHQEDFRALERRHDNFTFHLVLEVPDMMALMNNVKCREGRLADVVHDDLFLARTNAGGGLFDNIASDDILTAHTATYVLYGPESVLAPVRKMLIESDVPESQIIKPKIVG